MTHRTTTDANASDRRSTTAEGPRVRTSALGLLAGGQRPVAAEEQPDRERCPLGAVRRQRALGAVLGGREDQREQDPAEEIGGNSRRQGRVPRPRRRRGGD